MNSKKQIAQNLQDIRNSLPEEVTLVAVSKTKPEEAILEALEAGQRVFGENKVQEMVAKWEALPKNIEWHMIGHVQRNKVKYMAPFVHLIHGVDSLKLLKEIDKQAAKHERIINCLLQVHIAEEDTKFGLDAIELFELLRSETFQSLENIRIRGLMGMATFTENTTQITKEFNYLATLFKQLQQDHGNHPLIQADILSMGMSGDYKIAIDCGSNMVRIGSSIFGSRS